ncbi:MAG: hypothetical protein M3256_09030 [Actinomycetota bacterium]|nr:hypothetical protein [Actinomycetota bacterium]
MNTTGLKTCQQSHLSLPNKGYKYDSVSNYYLLDGACPPGPSSVDSVPGLVAVSIGSYKSSSLEDQGAQVYKDEIIDGRHFTTAGWSFGQFLVTVSHTAPSADVDRLMTAMRDLGARLVFDNRPPQRTTPAPAVLGAPPAAFVQRLGTPDPFGATHQATDNGIVPFVEQCSGQARGPGSEQYHVSFKNGHATNILRAICSGAPNLTFAQAKDDVQQFLPADAGVPTSFSAPPTTNPDIAPPPDNGHGEMYHSASLGSELPASAFEDCDHRPVTPGTLVWALTDIGEWYLTAGTCV